jgi:hypothetical protein
MPVITQPGGDGQIDAVGWLARHVRRLKVLRFGADLPINNAWCMSPSLRKPCKLTYAGTAWIDP